MNLKIEKFFMVLLYTLLFTVAGLMFNATIAFMSIWLQGIEVVVAALTGYGLYHLIRGSKL